MPVNRLREASDRWLSELDMPRETFFTRYKRALDSETGLPFWMRIASTSEAGSTLTFCH
jgi:hypothetical protein